MVSVLPRCQARNCLRSDSFTDDGTICATCKKSNADSLFIHVRAEWSLAPVQTSKSTPIHIKVNHIDQYMETHIYTRMFCQGQIQILTSPGGQHRWQGDPNVTLQHNMGRGDRSGANLGWERDFFSSGHSVEGRLVNPPLQFSVSHLP